MHLNEIKRSTLAHQLYNLAAHSHCLGLVNKVSRIKEMFQTLLSDSINTHSDYLVNIVHSSAVGFPQPCSVVILTPYRKIHSFTKIGHSSQGQHPDRNLVRTLLRD